MHAILTGSRKFAKPPCSILHSPEYPDSFSQQSSGEFTELAGSLFTGQNGLPAQKNRMLQNPVAKVEIEQLDRNHRVAGRSHRASMGDLMMIHLKID